MVLGGPHSWRVAALAVSAAFAAACGSSDRKSDEGAGPGPALARNPTYWSDVAPIVDERCASCHSPGGLAPISFDGYAATRSQAAAIAFKARAREMPPFPASSTCRPIAHDPSLTELQIATLEAWSASGAPEGDKADYRAVVPAALPDLGPPELVVAMDAPYTPAAAGLDEYRCFWVDPKLATSRDVIAADVTPGNKRLVHHVILFAVQGADATSAEALDAADPLPGFNCFGGAGPGIEPSWVAAWVPGSASGRFPQDTGIRLAAGTQFVLQVHYSLATARGESDQTAVELQLSPTPVPRPAMILPIPNKQLSLPAGQQQVEVSMNVPVPPTIPRATIWGAAGHMHLLGTRFDLRIVRATGGTECALEIPRWDFHWQQFYLFRDPLTVGLGDWLQMKCVYDNSAANQPELNGQRLPPRDVMWGEGTYDEMCLGLLYVTSP